MKKQCDEKVFLKDVNGHVMAVHLDQGQYRHLSFRKSEPNSWHFMWFEIVTWPGTLEIRGDMGTWSFSRIEDMFEFFRSRQDAERDRIYINPSYWGEKINAESRNEGPHRKFDVDVFKENIISCLDNYTLTAKKKKAVKKALDEEVFTGDKHEIELRDDLNNFTHDGFSFSDVWEISGEDYTYHYLWCCYAIAWGIQQYDKREKK